MYATAADLQARFGANYVKQLADRDHSGQADESLLASVLSGASSEIDAALGTRYTVPLSIESAVIKEHCLVLALGKLYNPGTMPEGFEVTLKATYAALSDFASGKKVLPNVPEKTIAGVMSSGSGVFYDASSEQITSDAGLKGFGA